VAFRSSRSSRSTLRRGLNARAAIVEDLVPAPTARAVVEPHHPQREERAHDEARPHVLVEQARGQAHVGGGGALAIVLAEQVPRVVGRGVGPEVIELVVGFGGSRRVNVLASEHHQVRRGKRSHVQVTAIGRFAYRVKLQRTDKTQEGSKKKMRKYEISLQKALAIE